MDSFISNFDPVAFSIGPLIVRWYALAYLAGFVLGWKYCLRLADKVSTRPNKEDIDNFFTWAIIGVIVGGRLGYTLFYNAQYYFSYPLEILQVWKGGMSFHGGVLGVMIAIIVFANTNKINMFRISDLVCAAAPIGLFFGRIANFVNAELYGAVTTQPWGVVFPGAGELPRHPSQLYEAFLEGIVLFILLWMLSRSANTKTGTVTGVFLLGYGLFRMLVEFVREPDAHIGLIAGMISMGQILCIPMILIGLLIVYAAQKEKCDDAQSV